MIDTYPSIDQNEIGAIATVGYYAAVRIGFSYPREELVSLPRGWMTLYGESGFLMDDPFLRWAYATAGTCRWSDVTLDDARGIRSLYADYGMKFGTIVSLCAPEDRGQRSVGLFARDDREMTDAEVTKLQGYMENLHDESRVPDGLTRAELEALNLVKDGLIVKQAAEVLGISHSAVKARLTSARSKLQARTISQATSRAVRLGLI